MGEVDEADCRRLRTRAEAIVDAIIGCTPGRQLGATGVTARAGVYATLDVVDGAETTWSWVDLKRPAVALTVVVAFALSAPAATIVSCNAHEVGHAVTGTVFGWKVDHISLCAPSGGAVHYRTSLSRGDAFESWAGGLTGALVLALAYVLAIGRNARPLRSPVIWAIGLGVAVPIGPQFVVAILEGTNRETSYSDVISENSAIWVPTLLISAALGPACHLWRWRAVSDSPAESRDHNAEPVR